MIKKIRKILYQPIIYFFLLPFISILPGSIFASQYNRINYLSFIALYIFIIVNQLIENILLRIPTNDFQLSKKILISFEIVNSLVILFFSWRHSWISAAILLLYTIIIQLQFLFTYYDLERTSAFISSFLKIIVLNGLSFYIHTNFVHYRFFLYYFGIFLSYFIYSLTRSERKTENKVMIALISFSYLFNIILLWKDIGYLSLLLLFSIPFIFAYKEAINKKYMATFIIVFSILYITLIHLAFIA